MQEALQTVHADEHSKVNGKEERKHQEQLNTSIITPRTFPYPPYNIRSTVSWKITVDSWACARERAHKRK